VAGVDNSMERKFQGMELSSPGTKVPGDESSKERKKFHRTFVTFVPGEESSWGRKYCSSQVKSSLFFSIAE